MRVIWIFDELLLLHNTHSLTHALALTYTSYFAGNILVFYEIGNAYSSLSA